MFNEHEHGETTRYISGRKIDLIAEVHTVDELQDRKVLELSITEFERVDISDDNIFIQENKNVRMSKSLLASVLRQVHEDTFVLGFNLTGMLNVMCMRYLPMSAIGLSGNTFSIPEGPCSIRDVGCGCLLARLRD